MLPKTHGYVTYYRNGNVERYMPQEIRGSCSDSIKTYGSIARYDKEGNEVWKLIPGDAGYSEMLNVVLGNKDKNAV